MEWPAEEGAIRTVCYGHDVGIIGRMFTETGLAIQKIWGSYTPLTEYNRESPRIIVEALKR